MTPLANLVADSTNVLRAMLTSTCTGHNTTAALGLERRRLHEIAHVAHLDDRLGLLRSESAAKAACDGCCTTSSASARASMQIIAASQIDWLGLRGGANDGGSGLTTGSS